MARKKSEEIELVENNTEEVQEIETDEAKLLDESMTRELSLKDISEDREIEAVAETESQGIEASPKPKRARRSRAKAIEAIAEIAIDEPKESKIEKNLKKDMNAASEVLDDTMKSILKQWTSMQEVTKGITENLERISNQLKVRTGESLDEVLTPKPEPKIAFITKFAAGASLTAILFSLLSLSLSQTARQAAITAQNTAPHISVSELESSSQDSVSKSSVLALRKNRIKK